MNKKFIVCLIIVAVGGGWWWFHAREATKKKAEAETIAKMAEAARFRVKAMAKQYNARLDWHKTLKVYAYPGLFTVEVEKAMISDDKRPILFLGTIKDIAGEENGYLCIFECNDFLTQIYVNVRCSDREFQTIIPYCRAKRGFFAVVANIEKVTRPSFKPTARYDDESKSASILLEDDFPSIFFAFGACLDVMWVENRNISSWTFLNDL